MLHVSAEHVKWLLGGKRIRCYSFSMTPPQQRTLFLAIAMIVVLLLLAYLLPLYIPSLLGESLVGGMTVLIVYWIVILAPGVVASAVCAGCMKRQSPIIKSGLFVLGVLVSALLTSGTLSLGAWSDSQTDPRFFWNIALHPVLYLVWVIATGFIVLLEYVGGKIHVVGRKQG